MSLNEPCMVGERCRAHSMYLEHVRETLARLGCNFLLNPFYFQSHVNYEPIPSPNKLSLKLR